MKKTKFPKLTAEEFTEILEGSGFPSAAKRTAVGGSAVTLIWSERVVDRWISERVAAAEKTLRLMRK